MIPKHLRKALSLILTGVVAISSAAVSAGAVSQSGTDTPSVMASASEQSLYLANSSQSLPDGSYFIYNVNTGTVMTSAIHPDNNSFPAFSSGMLDEAVTDLEVPEKYFYTFSNKGNNNYTIQNFSGQYLDIVGYGALSFTDQYTTLNLEPSTLDGTVTFNISKQVNGTSYSISMYSNEWFTVHNTEKSDFGQLMRMYKVENSPELRDLVIKINKIFDPDDCTKTKFSSGVTSAYIKDLVSKAAAYSLPQDLQKTLSRANDIVDGKTVEELAVFIPKRIGSSTEHAAKVHMKWFATDRQPTGIWVSPGEQFSVFVEAASGDPLPQIMFTQHISDCHEELTYSLQRGNNIITTPSVHSKPFSSYKQPDVEPGGLIYILNPYTEEQQSDKVRVEIKGGDKVPTFKAKDNTHEFLEKIKEYYKHYKNGEKGYHNCVELYSTYSYMTITLERTVEAYIQEGLSPTETVNNWDKFIDYMMAHAGMTKAEYENMYLGVKVNQPYAGAYSTPEMICIQDNNWLGCFLLGRYGWGFPHEVGHSMDDNTREYTEITNNMWSMKYVLEHNMYDSICVSKDSSRYDITLIAPEDQNNFWLDENRGDTHYFWQLPMFWDLEVYHNGYWAEVEKMFRFQTCGNEQADQYLLNATLKEKFSAYSSKILGIDLTYYFKKYGYLKNESSNYTNAINAMNLDTSKKPKLYYYATDSYNRKKISNVGKGDIEVSSFNTNTNTMYFSIPASCVEGHLGFEIVKNGKVVDFRWGNEYTETTALGSYTINAYDSQLNVYSSISFNPGSFSGKAVASVNGTYYNTLKAAIDAAPSGATVELLGSCYIKEGINISKAITLKPASSSKQIVIFNTTKNEAPFRITSGGSLTVKAYDESRDDMVVFDNDYFYDSDGDYTGSPFFDVSSASLTLGKGVTVQNCNSTSKGCVVKSTSSNITLNGCIISKNRTWYEGVIYLSGSSVLNCSGGTEIRFNKAKAGSAIYCDSAECNVSISNTIIHDNFNDNQDGATISLECGSLTVGSNTSIYGNADNFYGTNSAVFVGNSGKASFSGKLNITDNVNLTHSVSVDPGITGKLRLRADRTKVGNDFVLAVPSSGSFTASTYKALLYKHNVYHLAWNASSAYLTDKSEPKAKVTLSSYSIDKGKSVTIRCSATEGTAPYQYQIDVKHSSASGYTTIKGFSTSAYKTWKPALTGSYTVRLTVKDATGATSTDAHTLKVNAVIPALKNTSTLSVSTLTLGGAVRINCSATGGVKPYKYTVMIKKSSDKYYKTIKTESTVATKAYKPTSAGIYYILVKVKDSRGKIASKTLTLTVKAKTVLPLENKSSISATVIETGKAVKLTHAASGGTKAYKYAVYYRKSTSKYYTTLRKASTLTSSAFKPTSAGIYYIKVKAYDSKGKTADKVFKLTVKAPLKLSATISAKAIELGKYVTVKANATGGAASYKYAFYYKSASSKYYSAVRNYSTAKTANIKPKGTGKYNILVRVKDAKGKMVGKTFTITVSAPLKNNSTISAKAITLGNSVKITGKASGGTKTYKYAFYYKKSTAKKYVKLRNYTIAANAAFKPTSSGKYNIIVIVKDAKGSYVRKLFTLTVRAKLANKSTVSATSLMLGKTFTVNAAATGGLPTYKYAVYYKKSTADKYTAVKGFSTSKTASVKPSSAGKYNILVTVKDSEGTLVRKVFNVTVKPGLKNKSTLSASKITLGKSVVIKAAGYGGVAPYKYAVYFKKSGKSSYSELKSYSTNSKISFKPTSAGTYYLKVKVKDTRGKIVSKVLTLKVVKKA